MHISWSRQLFTFLSILTLSIAINRPVYKIILNSKGYAQFIQYDVDIPTLREFTLCVWVRVTSLESDQTIFTYIGNDENRIMRLWLDSGGRQIKISFEQDRVVTSAEVEFPAGVWRNVCFSYQAYLGAWALYIDTKVVSCEGSPNLKGFAFPGQGSLIFGYGTSEKGFPAGLTGEIYGATMILFSTIERSANTRKEPWYTEKMFLNKKTSPKNKQNHKYIVLGDLKPEEIQTVVPLTIHNEFGHHNSQLRDNIQMFSGLPALDGAFNNKKINDFSIDDLVYKDKNKYVNPKLKHNIFNTQMELKKELTGSSTRDLPIVLEYETPPPILAPTINYFAGNSESNGKTKIKHEDNDIMLSDVEKPPPLENDSKVYGQWTSSKFANNVLNYLKTINFNANKKQKKVPSTLPIIKLSDSYPYPSRFTYTKIHPPINYKKRLITENHHIIKRRDISGKQINVQIIKTDESDTSKLLIKPVNPKLVEVTNRGEPNLVLQESDKNKDDKKSFESIKTNDVSQISYQNHNVSSTSSIFKRHRESNVMNILPFIKSKQYFHNNRIKQSGNIDPYTVYSKSLSRDNKWYDVKHYNNDMTPQLITEAESHANAKASAVRKNRLIKSKPGEHKPGLNKQGNNDASIMYGRALAKEVSNQAKEDIYNIPLLKFKHDFFHAKDPKMTTSNNVAVKLLHDDDKVKSNGNNFNKHVKLGNALNEQFILGNDERQIKHTFLGGDDKIPDINRHRSKWDSKSGDIPSSLGARACKNIELYVQEDKSIGTSKILSPVHRANIGIEFIEQSYKKCSMNESPFKASSILLIDWIKTPVKLFGGAYPKITKDLCGFF